MKANSLDRRFVARTAALMGCAALTGWLLGACSSSASVEQVNRTVGTDVTSVVTSQADTGATSTTTGADSTIAISTSLAPPPRDGGAVLPVASNPIANTSDAKNLKIESVLVENNEDPSGKAASDHLEIALRNVGDKPLIGFEVFYTFTDPTAATTESYYLRLPAGFSVPVGATRVVHFDDTADPDHFPVNKFSLYRTSVNALDVTVTVSATDAAVQIVTVQKDAGGAEAAD